MSEDAFWRGRCGAPKVEGGGRCMLPAIARYGGRCYLHSPEGIADREHTSTRNRRAPEPRCKTVNPNGWPCRHSAAKGFDHCFLHLRAVLRAAPAPEPPPRVGPSEKRVEVVNERVRNERRLEDENTDLRRQITDLSVQLEKVRAELQLLRAWRKPGTKVNGEAQP
ncbi:MAG TPA: hypothetical protein VD838_19960 [Anaeromyxobacteraceae bacterium]|nr:hypothetical protein [Anaeromyxobacteraceae bacterium]